MAPGWNNNRGRYGGRSYDRDGHGRGNRSDHGARQHGSFHGGHGRGGRNHHNDGDYNSYRGNDRGNDHRPQHNVRDSYHPYGPPQGNINENDRQGERPTSVVLSQNHRAPSYGYYGPEDIQSRAVATGVANIPNGQTLIVEDSVFQPSSQHSNLDVPSSSVASMPNQQRSAAIADGVANIPNGQTLFIEDSVFQPSSPRSDPGAQSSAVASMSNQQQSAEHVPGQNGDGNGVHPAPEQQFFDHNYFKQLKAQIPASEGEEAFLRSVPQELYECKERVYSREWKNRKYMAAKKVVNELQRCQAIRKQNVRRDMEESEDEEDYEPIYCTDNDRVSEKIKMIDAETKMLEKWIFRLPTCHLLTLGFDFPSSVAGEKCYCPCHEVRMNVWRDLAGVYIDGKAQCKGSNDMFGKPNRLVAHLKANSDKFHQCTLQYLEELYADWYPNHTKHKGLEIEGSKEYTKALDQENRQRDRKLKRMKEDLEAAMERVTKQDEISKELEELRKTNADQARMYEAKLQAREEIMAKLGVDLDDPSSSMPPSADLMFEKHERKFGQFLDQIALRFSTNGKKCDARSIQVEQGFCLQDCFEKWSRNKNEFAHILFRDIENEKDVQKLLSTWRIDYAAHEALQGGSKALQKKYQSVDKGGPEAQFFSEIWRMLPRLEVSLPGSKKRLKLFEPVQNHSTAYIPTKNEQFEGKGPEAISKAKVFYRAIGRIFAHCVCNRRAVPREVLPKLLCNAVLRDCRPKDPDYLPRDLGYHLLSLGWNEKIIAEATKEKNEEKNETGEGFPEFIDKFQIEERSIWFESFREGLVVKRKKTGEEYVRLPEVLSSLSFENVDRLIFATHDFPPGDLFSIMDPTYSGSDTLQQNQKALFEGLGGKDGIFQKWFDADHANTDNAPDPTRLHQFLQFCTGQDYLPDWKSGFKIQVVFETKTGEGNSSSDDRFPECHTCVNMLSIPKTAYGGNIEVFEEKLAFAIKCYDKFDQH